MKLKAVLLICTALIIPSQANAGAVFWAILSGGGGIGAAFGATAIGSFLTGTTLGSLLLNIGISYLLTPKAKAPTIEATRVNSRLANSPRWQLAGTVLAGGEVGIFAEHDADGNFWYIVGHGDAKMATSPQYFFDGIPVTRSDGTDGFTAGDVTTDAFCAGDKWAAYTGTGTKVPIFRIYRVTPGVSAAYGTLPAAFTTAFPSLPADFRLAGVSFSIIRIAAIPSQHYGTHMRYRGPIGIGEPSVTVAANWNRIYDPRDAGQDIDDPTTWEFGDGNPALIWAWWRINGFGRNRPHTEINWDLVADAADACDQEVLDRTATAIPRYRCGVAFPDSKPRQECEQEILATMAAFVAYDDQGRAYPVPGIYEAPSITFARNRDIISSQTQVVDDGENMIDGVIVEYLSPAHNWTKVESAPWVNAAYYDGTAEPNYRKVAIEGCQNHNQAVRLAKAIGLEVGATHRAALSTTVKGILAEGKRNITLDLDEEFSGVFKIASPIEEDQQGMACGFAVVPMGSDFYDLNEGEEGVPPALTPVLDIDTTIETAANVVVSSVSVPTSDGSAVRLEATFDAPVRVDRTFRFRFSVNGASPAVYEDFVVDMDELRAWSAIVSDGVTYRVQWQTVSPSGAGTDWNAGVTKKATADTVAPPSLASASAAGGVGEATASFTTATSSHQKAVRGYVGSTTVFADAAPFGSVTALSNSSGTITATGLSAGTARIWLEPLNGSGVPGPTSGPFTVTIT